MGTANFRWPKSSRSTRWHRQKDKVRKWALSLIRVIDYQRFMSRKLFCGEWVGMLGWLAERRSKKERSEWGAFFG